MQVNFLNLNNSALAAHTGDMRYFHSKLDEHLKELGMTFYQLQFLAGIPSSHFSQWKKSKDHKDARTASDTDLKKLASVKELGLDEDTLFGWRAAEQYTAQQLKIGTTLRQQYEAMDKPHLSQAMKIVEAKRKK